VSDRCACRQNPSSGATYLGWDGRSHLTWCSYGYIQNKPRRRWLSANWPIIGICVLVAVGFVAMWAASR
jgi:hypothetical protein